MIYFSTDETTYRLVRNKAIKYIFNFQRDNTFTLLLKGNMLSGIENLHHHHHHLCPGKKYDLLFRLSAGQHIVYIFKIHIVTIRPVAKKKKISNIETVESFHSWFYYSYLLINIFSIGTQLFDKFNKQRFGFEGHNQRFQPSTGKKKHGTFSTKKKTKTKQKKPTKLLEKRWIFHVNLFNWSTCRIRYMSPTIHANELIISKLPVTLSF